MHPKPDTARDPSADARAPKVLLVTPPLLQPNAPYAAMPAIAGFLKAQGVEVVQADLSLELVLELFSEEGIDLAVRAARRMRRPSPEASFLLNHEDAYRRWIGPAVAFLIGLKDEFDTAAQDAPAFMQQFGGAEHGRHVKIVPAGMHVAVLGSKGKAGFFFDRQAVGIRTDRKTFAGKGAF